MEVKMKWLILISFLLVGCATIFKGSTDSVNFTSDPNSAKVYVDGLLLGKTPVELELKSNETYSIEFKKEGYETRTVILHSSVGAIWVILDILGGLIPVIIDAATGNWYGLDKDHVNGVLENKNQRDDKLDSEEHKVEKSAWDAPLVELDEEKEKLSDREGNIKILCEEFNEDIRLNKYDCKIIPENLFTEFIEELESENNTLEQIQKSKYRDYYFKLLLEKFPELRK